ncbi:mechanosensitive ion channel family protein [Aquifex pyrophilus]
MEQVLTLFKDFEKYVNLVILGIPLYKIALSLLVFFLSIFIRKVVLIVLVKTLGRTVFRTKSEIDDKLFKALSKPVSFLIVVGGLVLSLIILGLEKVVILKIFKTFLIFTLGWISLNFVRVFEKEILELTERFGKELSKEIGSFAIKLLKAFVITLTATAILQEWGINVSALIASLGLLGLAASLAAKDTLENIISGFVILLDKPFHIGETGNIGGVIGTVEDIGLRSTKVRTFDKTLVVIPNRNVVNENIENWSRRDKRRVRIYIGVVYSTTRKQMERILRDIRSMLSEHPGVAKDEKCFVYFERFSDSSLDILVQYYTNTADYEEYLKIVEDVNLKIMDIVERNGSSFAFPSRSIYVEKIPDKINSL